VGRTKLVSYIALFVGLSLYLFSAYYRFRFGVTQEYTRILILSLFVMIVSAVPIVVLKLKSEPQSVKPWDIKALYFLLIAVFSVLLILGLQTEGIIREAAALSLLLGLSVLMVPVVLIVVTRKLRNVQRIGPKEDAAITPVNYYLGLAGIIVFALFALFVMVQVVRYLA